MIGDEEANERINRDIESPTQERVTEISELGSGALQFGHIDRSRRWEIAPTHGAALPPIDDDPRPEAMRLLHDCLHRTAKSSSTNRLSERSLEMNSHAPMLLT
jgi:hypothetical protein